MTWQERITRFGAPLRSVRVRRLLVILFAALVAGLLTDWVRRDRVLFPRPLPEFKTVPAEG